jgi:hypothetical protein
LNDSVTEGPSASLGSGAFSAGVPIKVEKLLHKPRASIILFVKPGCVNVMRDPDAESQFLKQRINVRFIFGIQ